MSDIFIKIPAADAQWQPDPDQPNYLPQPQPSTLIAEFNDGADQHAYLYTGNDLTAWPNSASYIGSWDERTGLQEGQAWDNSSPPQLIGTPTHPVTDDYTTYIRPLGNDAGRATGILDSIRWQGHSEPKYLEDDKRYKDTESPFTLKITRQEITAPDPFPGWGWTVEMISEDPARDITARAVGIYSDPECTAFLYTTGAFIQDGSHDNNYYTECPAGQRTGTPDQVNFALLLGSAQEGFFNLPENSSTTEALFWAKDQGASADWAAGISYAIDDEVSYQGTAYRCIQAHTSQVGWEPPNVPALWTPV